MEQHGKNKDELARKQKLGPQGVPRKPDGHQIKPPTTDRDLPQTGGSFDDGHVK